MEHIAPSTFWDSFWASMPWARPPFCAAPQSVEVKNGREQDFQNIDSLKPIKMAFLNDTKDLH